MDTKKLRAEIEAAITAIKTIEDCNAFHQKYLGKSGVVSGLMGSLRDIAPEMRGAAGAEFNAIKRDTESRLFKLQEEIRVREINEKLMNDARVDITLPDLGRDVGNLHPITRVLREVEAVFGSMGFYVEDGPEIATEFENFESLNIPKNHPARDMQDTFWLSNGSVLKTHTSASQNRMLKKYGPEFSAIFPGRCYRNENLDASHEMAFFQVEGMMVGRDISIANLIYFMRQMLAAVFKKDVKVRLRPGFFPFTEPSFELDASCVFCDAKGCSVCKKSGWVEFCGCGMIHPRVLEMGGVNPTEYQGFAFGFGLTRLAMLKYGVDDVRVFNSGNLEALAAIK
ncbi:MAG: phenylalanine--tRNA ligase subunit alpha [Firmicutes bacterium]|nr:phenylalanine--tRNA ligase subunit alpha [Bacillota bacterium]